MSRINLRYGIDSISKDFADNPTIGDLKDDENIQAVLGYGDNVKALVNGVEMSDDVTVPHGSTVVFETAANTKAQS